jgi:tetratricopeptide (TPR) repeat protein
MLRPSSPLVLALLLAALPATAAAASEPTPSEISVARRLFDEGKAAEDARRFREAAEKFRKAVAIKDTPGLRFHLARCEEEQGALVEALVEYDRARELLESGVKAPDVERLLPEARRRVQSQVASFTWRLPEGVEEAVVELDGRPLASSTMGIPIPVNPGKHRLSATAPGRRAFGADLELGVGQARQLTFELPVETVASPPQSRDARPAAPPPVERRPRQDTNTARTVTLVSEATLFAAGLTTGIAFTLSKNGAAERYDRANELVLAQVGGSDPNGDACVVPREGCAELDDAQRDEKRDGRIATAGFVTAGVSALAFGLTLVLWKTERAPRVQTGIGPNRATLLISTRF